MQQKPDWGKRAVIAAYVLGIPTIGMAILGYVRPPDPARPMSFDFLSRSISMPPWLVVAAALIIAFGSAAATRWYVRRSLAANPSSPSGFTPPKIPAILKVSIKFLPIEDSGQDRVAIIMRNTGGSPALHIQFDDIHVFQTRIRFFEDIPLLAPGAATKPVKPFVVEFPASKNHDVARAMFEATYKLYGSRTNKAYDYQGGATFFDADGTKYQAAWIYTFYPYRFNRARPDDPDLAAEGNDEIGPYLTVSDVGISEIPS